MICCRCPLWRLLLSWPRPSLVSSRNVMAVYPDSLAVPIPPMSWPPNVIHAAGPVAGTTNIIRPIPNVDHDSAASVVRAGTVTIIRSVITWVSGVIALAASSPEQGGKQKNQQNESSRSGFCFIRSCLINNAHFHIIIFGFGGVLRACIYQSEIVETISRLSCFPGPRRVSGSFLVAENLHNALIQHCVSHFDESGDVCTDYEVARVSVFFGGFPCVLVDRGHDVTQT